MGNLDASKVRKMRQDAHATMIKSTATAAAAAVLGIVLQLAWVVALLPVAVSGKKHLPVKLFILAGEANIEGFASMGDLKKLVTTVPKNGGLPPYSHLWNATTKKWTVRDDVFVTFDHSRNENWTHGPLTVGSFGGDAGSFGPELQLGHVLGDFYEDPVVIVKAGWKGRSLAKDFCPPKEAGESLTSGKNTGCFQWYRMMMNIQRTASLIHEVVGPAYKHARIDVMGMVWWHGYTDFADSKLNAAYADNLEKFIHAVRAELKQPYMPILVADLGGQGSRTKDRKELQFREMQDEVCNERLNNYTTILVPTSPYVKTMPAIRDYTMYFGNAPTMLEISQAFAMTLMSEDNNFIQGDSTFVWIDAEPDVITNGFETFTQAGMMMMIGIVAAGVFSFVAIMRYGGRMDRAWDTAFSRLRPSDDQKEIELNRGGSNGRMKTRNPMVEDDDDNGYHDDGRQPARTLPDIRRSGHRVT